MPPRDFDALLLDMDGTLYHEQHVLPGVPEAITRLQRAGLPLGCVTNNSAHTAEQLAARLADMGVVLPAARIYTAARAMADLILRHPTTGGRKPRVFNFAGLALPVELADRVEWVDGPSESCDIVAVGTHMRENNIGFDMDRAVVALAHLRRGAALVAGCNDRVFPIGGGVEFGSGAWARLFAYAADLGESRITFAGKPSPAFFAALPQHMNVAPQRCLLVGDNLEADILGARAVGMKTALVLTGVSQPEDIARTGITPDWVAADLMELVDRLDV